MTSLGYTHPWLGFEVNVPPGSEARDDIAGAALVVAEPVGEPRAFRANLVVTVEDGDWEGLDAYTDSSIAAQVERLVGFRLIDRADVTLGRGGAATRTLGHHDAFGTAVALEQWRIVRGSRAYTLTASCWTLDYEWLADGFAATVETFAP